VSRSPLSYPLNRGMDTDAGGAADLQTDVMRFMAIISLCLVAIFALVQSLPASPPRPAELKPAATAAATRPIPDLRIAKPSTRPRQTSAVDMPQPARQTEAAPERVALPPAVPYREPARTKTPAPPPPAPASSQPTPPTEARPAAAAAADGFTLRFESDLALTRLVARNEIGLYAIRPGKALRMSVNRGAVAFWPASSPGRFHEMEESTVPAGVVDALRRSGRGDAVTWGVTLPAGMTRDLNRYLDEHAGGSLVIGASGDLRLER